MTIACDKQSPPSPPVVATPPTVETVSGTERVGWDQPAADTVELATIGYAIYVDGARTTLAGVTCAATAASTGFPCTARLPSMSAGAHTLELASFVNDGGVLESARSAALRVTVAAATTANRHNAAALRAGLTWRGDPMVEGLQSPADVAFAPDGRVFVADAAAIRIVQDGRLLDEPSMSRDDGRILALALDPQFERTHHLFAIYAAPARSGELTFSLARFREVANTLGDAAVLLDGVPASASPSAALRFGPDGKLYAAFDAGGDRRRSTDLASMNGKVVRLNADGTTPADARGGVPVFAGGFGSPIALDWDPQTATLWVADAAAGGSRFAFYRGPQGSAGAGRMMSADTLFARGTAAGLTFLAVAPDGAVYYGAPGALGRVAPERAP